MYSLARSTTENRESPPISFIVAPRLPRHRLARANDVTYGSDQVHEPYRRDGFLASTRCGGVSPAAAADTVSSGHGPSRSVQNFGRRGSHSLPGNSQKGRRQTGKIEARRRNRA